MFKKKECYLCGGKLINGRCSSCGLDNTKLDKKNYRLNESSFDRKKKMTYSQKRQNDTGETKNREKKKDAGHLCESHNGRKRTQTEYQQKENPRIEIPQTGQMQPGGPTVFNPARKAHTGSYEEQKKQGKSVEFLRELSWQSYHLQALQVPLVISFPHLGMISIPQIMTGMMMAAKWSLSMIHI